VRAICNKILITYVLLLITFFIMPHKHKTIKKVVLVLIVLVLMWLSFGTGIYFTGRNEVLKNLAQEESVFIGKILGKYSEVKDGRLAQDIDFDLFWDVWDSIDEQYVDKENINEKELFYGAIRGMVSAVGDPYTVFMNPRISKDFSNDLAGTFEGIGAEIGIKNDVLTIIAPLPDMPAEKAGLRPGDKVLAINDESTAGITIDEAVNKIRGPKDTEVKLSIHRDEANGIQEIIVKRGKIIVKSVRTEHRADDIFVIKITNFNEDTQELFNKAVREVIEKDPSGIILDLRSNPGGFLDTAIEVASEWIENDVIVSEKSSEELLNEHLSRGRPRLKDYKTVILVNQGSASASEIVSGALQDYDKAVVVGKKTFGKGSVQTLNKFKDGSSIKITVAKWLTPKGRSINDEGIAPDHIVHLSLEEYNANKDPQMEVAVKILLGEDFSDLLEKTSTTTDENIK